MVSFVADNDGDADDEIDYDGDDDFDHSRWEGFFIQKGVPPSPLHHLLLITW